MRPLPAILLVLLLSCPLPCATSHSKSTKPRSPQVKCAGCPRDSKGKIKRSRSAKREFQKTHPCPATGRTTGRCPGYVIDHVIPLKHGGADAPWNMQRQTTAEGKAKDRVED